jgi:hypothetical protein
MTPNRSTRTFLILLFVAAPGFSQPPALPDTPAGHVLFAWLDAFNSGDEARLAAFDASMTAAIRTTRRASGGSGTRPAASI